MCNNEVDDNNVDARRSDEGMLMQDEVMKFILMIMNRGLKCAMMNRGGWMTGKMEVTMMMGI